MRAAVAAFDVICNKCLRQHKLRRLDSNSTRHLCVRRSRALRHISHVCEHRALLRMLRRHDNKSSSSQPANSGVVVVGAYKIARTSRVHFAGATSSSRVVESRECATDGGWIILSSADSTYQKYSSPNKQTKNTIISYVAPGITC